MTARCTITRAGTGPGAYDPATGKTEGPTPTTVYCGPCRIQPAESSERIDIVGGQALTVRLYRVAVPLAVTDVAPDDRIRVDACDDTYLVGRDLDVTDVTGSSVPAQRDLIAEDRLG